MRHRVLKSILAKREERKYLPEFVSEQQIPSQYGHEAFHNQIST